MVEGLVVDLLVGVVLAVGFEEESSGVEVDLDFEAMVEVLVAEVLGFGIDLQEMDLPAGSDLTMLDLF